MAIVLGCANIEFAHLLMLVLTMFYSDYYLDLHV